jgi:segregation and condensation protein B
MADPEAKRIVEAVLFSSSDPLTTSSLAGVLEGTDGRAVRKMIGELNEEYEQRDSAFRIQEIAGGFQMLTRPDFAPWVDQLHRVERKTKLSQAALETLALIAHRQPITRAEIESIRGVQCGDILRSLIEKRLVKISGRKDAPGRPLLYGTTRFFLEHFGLASLEDLDKLGMSGMPR